MFATMGIETAADLWPDFFVASGDSTDPNFFSLSGAKEILRRKKVIVLEWDGGAHDSGTVARVPSRRLDQSPQKPPSRYFFGRKRAD